MLGQYEGDQYGAWISLLSRPCTGRDIVEILISSRVRALAARLSHVVLYALFIATSLSGCLQWAAIPSCSTVLSIGANHETTRSRRRFPLR